MLRDVAADGDQPHYRTVLIAHRRDDHVPPLGRARGQEAVRGEAPLARGPGRPHRRVRRLGLVSPEGRPRLLLPRAVRRELHQGEARPVHHHDAAVGVQHRDAVAGVVEDAAVEALALLQPGGVGVGFAFCLETGTGFRREGHLPALERPMDGERQQPEHEGDEARGDAEADRGAARQPRLGRPAREQRLLVGAHLVAQRTNLVHHVPAVALDEPGPGTGGIAGLEAAPHLGHLAQLLVRQHLEARGRLALRRIRGHEHVELDQRGPHGRLGVVVGGEERAVGREEIAAVTRLRAKERQDHPVDRLYHLVGVIDGLGGPGEARTGEPPARRAR